jgi:hypothetical protein
MGGSNRKNLARQIGRVIPSDVPMRLHATTMAPQVTSTCFTCGEPIQPGQRVRWCEVPDIVPIGFIHAQHFDAGPITINGRSGLRKRQSRRQLGPCKWHHWSPWRRAGIFDPTEVRTCLYCPATRTRTRPAGGE